VISKNNDLYIIIPVYNDSVSARRVIEELIQTGYHNIIVIDDGSSDDLLNSLRPFDLTYIKHSINLGQGAALQTGILFARTTTAEIIVTFDADGQHSSKDIAGLIAPIKEDQLM
jgi:glycosyltransferase involved in cell wall biosynthesis